MELTFAPMEGVTSYIFRRVHREMFPQADSYYAPFIAPDPMGNFGGRSLRDVLPENNRDVKLVPQILCNRPEPFLIVAKQLQDMGYTEVNLNAGCPSQTVVPKHKGAGMLLDLDSLDSFLAEVFDKCSMKVSIKTRLGVKSTEEFYSILPIYNKYPISRLIIHARDKAGMYKSIPDRDVFAWAFNESTVPVAYNGNVFDPASMEAVQQFAPGIDSIMLGRGAVSNPALFRQLKGGAALEAAELKEFHDRILDAYLSSGLDERYSTARMKELWHYFILMFPNSKKGAKRINKSRLLCDYVSAVSELFSEGSFSSEAGYG